jgi:hypothetical protein
MSLGELLPKIKSLSYLFTDSNGASVAHCLDLDLVATGENREIAERRLDNLVRAQIRTISERFNFADLNFSAPPDYWTKFYDGQEFKKAKLELEVPPNFVLPVEQKVYVPVFMRAMPTAA